MARTQPIVAHESPRELVLLTPPVLDASRSGPSFRPALYLTLERLDALLDPPYARTARRKVAMDTNYPYLRFFSESVFEQEPYNHVLRASTALDDPILVLPNALESVESIAGMTNEIIAWYSRLIIASRFSNKADCLILSSYSFPKLVYALLALAPTFRFRHIILRLAEIAPKELAFCFSRGNIRYTDFIRTYVRPWPSLDRETIAALLLNPSRDLREAIATYVIPNQMISSPQFSNPPEPVR